MQVCHRTVRSSYHRLVGIPIFRTQRHRCTQPPSRPVRTNRAHRLTILLDIDETLVHSIFENGRDLGAPLDEVHSYTTAENTALEPVENFELHLEDRGVVTVHKRPGLEAFMDHLASRKGKEGFRVVAFTAAVTEYASPLCDVLDPDGLIFDAMFYRDSCTIKGNQYQKDLDLVINKMRQQDDALRDLKKAEQAGILARLRQSMADPVTSLNYSLAGQKRPYVYRQDEYWDVTNEQLDLSRTVLVDNNPVCHVMYPQNGILVPSFFDDPRDQELAKVSQLLDQLLEAQDDDSPADVRDFLRGHPMAADAEGED